jgi:hypothetical protein
MNWKMEYKKYKGLRTKSVMVLNMCETFQETLNEEPRQLLSLVRYECWFQQQQKKKLEVNGDRQSRQ